MNIDISVYRISAFLACIICFVFIGSLVTAVTIGDIAVTNLKEDRADIFWSCDTQQRFTLNLFGGDMDVLSAYDTGITATAHLVSVEDLKAGSNYSFSLSIQSSSQLTNFDNSGLWYNFKTPSSNYFPSSNNFSFNGTVRNSDGSAVSGAIVLFSVNGPGQYYPVASKTDTNGSFSLSPVNILRKDTLLPHVSEPFGPYCYSIFGANSEGVRITTGSINGVPATNQYLDDIVLSPIHNSEVQIFKGFNLIGLPVKPSDPNPSTASQLLSRSLNYQAIYKFNGASQSYEFLFSDQSGGYYGTDFSLEEGQSYFIKSTGTETLTFSGQRLTMPKPQILYKGFNAVSIPYTSFLFGSLGSGFSLSSFLDQFKTLAIYAFNGTSQSYNAAFLTSDGTFLPTGDVKISSSMGFFVKSLTAESKTFPEPAFNDIIQKPGHVNVTDLTLAPSSVSLILNLTSGPETTRILATVFPENASDTRVNWITSSSSVATVDEYGTVTPHGIGTALIKATTVDRGKSASVNLTVVSDSQAPIPGNSGKLSISNISATGLDLAWTIASDDFTTYPSISYMIVRSGENNISSPSLAIANGITIKDWTPGAVQCKIQGLAPSSSYWVNVLAIDVCGNKSAYSMVHVTTSEFSLVNGSTATIDVDPDSGTKMNFCYVPPGTFTMGSPITELGRGLYENEHQVTLSTGYYIGQFEVTQAQWLSIMKYGIYWQTGDNKPADQVTWYDCALLCNKISTASGLIPAYYADETFTTVFSGNSPYMQNTPVYRKLNATGFRLPTEAEWEYACRAGTIRAYNDHTKNNSEGSDCTSNTDLFSDINLDVLGKYSNNENQESHGYVAVGSYQPNAWNLYDMHGNVYEWCSDWYGLYPTDATTDPIGPTTSFNLINRVIRGGCWHYFASSSRSAARNSLEPPNGFTISVGLRVVLPLSQFTSAIPTLTTSAITDVTETSISTGGIVVSDGDLTVIERGICWSAEKNPSISDSRVVVGAGAGTFTCELTSLEPGTTYCIRAYATNSSRTGYGDELTFTTKGTYIPKHITSNSSALSTKVTAGPGLAKTLSHDSGKISITFPSAVTGASFEVSTKNATICSYPNSGQFVGKAYTVAVPTGTTLAKAVTITISYDDTNLTSIEDFLTIIKYDETAKTLTEFTGITINKVTNTISGTTTAFPTLCHIAVLLTPAGTWKFCDSTCNSHALVLAPAAGDFANSIEGSWEVTGYANAKGTLTLTKKTTTAMYATEYTASGIYDFSTLNAPNKGSLTGTFNITATTAPMLATGTSTPISGTSGDWKAEYCGNGKFLVSADQTASDTVMQTFLTNLKAENMANIIALLDSTFVPVSSYVAASANHYTNLASFQTYLINSFAGYDFSTMVASVAYAENSGSEITCGITITSPQSMANFHVGVIKNTGAGWKIVKMDLNTGLNGPPRIIAGTYGLQNAYLTIPSGALIAYSAPSITAVTVAPNLTLPNVTPYTPDGLNIVYRAEPAELNFLIPVTFTMKFDRIKLPVNAAYPEMVRIFAHNGSGWFEQAYSSPIQNLSQDVNNPNIYSITSSVTTLAEYYRLGSDVSKVTVDVPPTVSVTAESDLGESTRFTWLASDPDSSALKYQIAITTLADSEVASPSLITLLDTSSTDASIKELFPSHFLTNGTNYLLAIRANDDADVSSSTSIRPSKYGSWKTHLFTFRADPAITRVVWGNMVPAGMTILWTTSTIAVNSKVHYTFDEESISGSPLSQIENTTQSERITSNGFVHVANLSWMGTQRNTIRFYVTSDSPDYSGVTSINDNGGNYYSLKIGPTYQNPPGLSNINVFFNPNQFSDDLTLAVLKVDTSAGKTHNFISAVSSNRVTLICGSNCIDDSTLTEIPEFYQTNTVTDVITISKTDGSINTNFSTYSLTENSTGGFNTDIIDKSDDAPPKNL